VPSKSGALKFLIDVGVGKSIEKWLAEKAYDTCAVRHINPSMTDREIVLRAREDNRIIITMDKDFGELIYQSHMTHAGVLLLRLEDESAEEKLRVVRKILAGYSDKIAHAFSVYQNGRLRVRHTSSHP